MSDNNQETQARTPDPALQRLDRLVGTWTLTGHLVGSDEENVSGEIAFHWLEGGFFLQQDAAIDFAGMFQVKARELIGYDPATGAFASYVYSNLSPEPLPYKWDLRGDTLTISVTYGPLDASFEGRFSEDGESFSGGWRPNPGADETINVPYDVTGTRVK
jgi:Protein of unknown function (DUF1579)